MKLFVVRHGTTEWNNKRIYQGQMDSRLTKKGVKLAESIGKKLKKENISAIYTSDLLRAKKTAQIIAKQTGVKKILIKKDLREINYGIFEGRKKSEVRKEHPLCGIDPHFKCPKGESVADVQKRAVKIARQIEKKHKKENILIVTHTNVIRGLLSYYRSQPLRKYIHRKIPHEFLYQLVRR